MATTESHPSMLLGPAEPDTEQLVLWPHRSLGRCGLLLVLTVIAVVFVSIATWAAFRGAWPVLVYALLALGGATWAFACNNRSARWAQVIELGPSTIRVSEVGPAARCRAPVEFTPGWVRVVQGLDAQNETRVLLRQSGRSVAVGDCLSQDERIKLARHLQELLARRYASPAASTRA